MAVALVLGVVVFFLLRRGLRGDLPSATEKAEQIGRLEATVLPVIEELQIAYFMDEPDCANLTYPRGDFIDGDPELCGGSTDSPIQFDDVARADHDRIKAALAASRTPIERVGGRFSDDGRVVNAWFMSTHGAPLTTSWSLEYDPTVTLPNGTAGIVTRIPIEGVDGWWFACCAD